MYITLIVNKEEYIPIAEELGFDVVHCDIKEYEPHGNQVFYVSPSNSLGYMDGGIDKAYMEMFPDIQKKVQTTIRKHGKTSLLGRFYLPIGSAIIIKATDGQYLISAPTMLQPQNVSKTRNAYFSTKAIFNVLRKWGHINNSKDELILVPMCTGWGKMDIKESLNQMNKAIEDVQLENMDNVNEGTIFYINEPNLREQPKYHENTEWIDIKPEEIITK